MHACIKSFENYVNDVCKIIATGSEFELQINRIWDGSDSSSRKNLVFSYDSITFITLTAIAFFRFFYSNIFI